MRARRMPNILAKALVALACAAVASALAPAAAFADHFKDYLVTEGEPCTLSIGSCTFVDGEFEVTFHEGRAPAGLEFSTSIEGGNIYLLLSGTPERTGSFTFVMDWTDTKDHITVDLYTIRVTVRPVQVSMNAQRGFLGQAIPDPGDGIAHWRPAAR